MTLLDDLRNRKQNLEQEKEKAWETYLRERDKIREIEQMMVVLAAKGFLQENPSVSAGAENESDFVQGFLAGALWKENLAVEEWPSLTTIYENLDSYLNNELLTGDEASESSA